MIKRSASILSLAVVVVAVAFLAPREAKANAEGVVPLEPVQAIEMAKSAPSRSVKGTFAFEIAATGRGVGPEKGQVHLNSMNDYRDPGCITVVIRRGLLPKVKETLGAELEAMVGKRILVEGELKRVKIYFPTYPGESKLRYYYQNHIRLDSASSIALAGQ